MIKNTLAKKLNKNWKKNLFYISLIALPLLQFIIMYIVVNINSFVLAFRSYDAITRKWSWVGFYNFKNLFYDISTLPQLTHGFKNSLMAFAVRIIVGIPLALIFSYYIFKQFFGYKLFRILLFLPSVISAIVLIIMFKYYADALIPTILKKYFGIKMTGLLSDKETIFSTVLFFNIFISFGVSVLMYTSAMTSISTSSFEAAEIDGAGEFRQFALIALPQIVPTIAVFVTTTVATLFTDQLNLYSFFEAGAGHRYYTIGYYIYRSIQKATTYAEYPIISALGICITIVVAPLVLFIRWLFNKLDPMKV